ncbi:MAG: hypothetical protein ACRDG4_02395 [Chloroflexota bacterium]
MENWHASVRIGRRRRVRIRKIFTLISALVIAVAVMMFLSMDVTSVPGQETIGGRDDTRLLLLPMGLFIIGMIGLALCLP